jgi:hypothetical protein
MVKLSISADAAMEIVEQLIAFGHYRSNLYEMG